MGVWQKVCIYITKISTITKDFIFARKLRHILSYSGVLLCCISVQYQKERCKETQFFFTIPLICTKHKLDLLLWTFLKLFSLLLGAPNCFLVAKVLAVSWYVSAEKGEALETLAVILYHSKAHMHKENAGEDWDPLVLPAYFQSEKMV